MYSIDVLAKSIRIPSQVSDEDFVVVDVVVKQVGYLLKKGDKGITRDHAIVTMAVRLQQVATLV